MKLYYIFQDENTGEGTFHAAIVAADTKEEARSLHPGGDWSRVDLWCYEEEEVHVRLLGTAAKSVGSGVILASMS